MLKNNLKMIAKRLLNNSLVHVIFLALIVILGIGVFFVYEDFFLNKPDPIYTLSFLLTSLVILLVLCILLANNKASEIFVFSKNPNSGASRLRKRIIVAFSIGAALPTIVVAVFSTYFFNFGIEAWFDKKISKVLDQSVSVGESYIAEHVLQIKETAISVSDDLSAMYYDLIHNAELFSKVLNAQAEMRSIDEAIVFQKDTNNILAQTNLSFSLSFLTIPSRLIERADQGEIIQINSDPTKIRILIKLRDYNDTYLLIGRLVDSKIIDHIDQTNGAAGEYFRLRDNLFSMQVKFSVVFILLSLILLVVAIIWGRSFSNSIVSPIRELVKAAERVKNGDLSAEVPLEGLKKDEVKVLSSAFNRMVNQLNRQQKDLAVAQRSLAWSDVARRVAHEIKNPLTPIQLSADLLIKKFADEVSDKETFVKCSQNILKHSNNIKNIVSEFVEFARLPSPSFTLCEIVSMINDLIESRKLINDTIDYQFSFNEKSFDFVCDIAQINAAIVNLLLNAEESFDHSCSNKRIKVELNIDGDRLSIAVMDNGPGFSDKLLSSAKEAYVTTKSKGTGLGLAIVDRISLDHFGEMRVSNNVYGGGRIELIFSVSELKIKLK
ncbi:MAG: HAMP domain-containing protein [Rickettsiaceae bacterium]|nr:HAMP domain-containing protein [Rickettsiaceae bacterium]